MEKSAAFQAGFAAGIEKTAGKADMLDSVGGLRLPSALIGAAGGGLSGAVAGGLGGAAGAEKGDRFRAAGRGALTLGAAGAALGGATGAYGGHRATKMIDALKKTMKDEEAAAATARLAEVAERAADRASRMGRNYE
jgi:hypothetical protein